MQTDVAEQIIKRALRKWIEGRRAFQDTDAYEGYQHDPDCYCDWCGRLIEFGDYADLGFCSKACSNTWAKSRYTD